jgi:hypothetical protein
MNIRSIRLVTLLVPVLAVGTGVSLASSGSAGVVAGNPQSAAFCPADSRFVQPRTNNTPTHGRIALHCHCCGRDENGHCNHQCCD